MICRIETKDVEEIKPTNILTQTSYWARVKHEQGFIPNGFQLTVSKDILNPSNNPAHTVQDDLLILIKDIDVNFCYAYVPYGPKLEPTFENQGILLEEISEVIKPYLPNNCVYIRYDLMWENQWAKEEEFYDHQGNWQGPPPNKTQEFRLNFNTHNWNLQKSSIDILPKNTFFLNLKLREEELLNQMRYNTRYNIKGAIQKGVRVKEYGIEYLDTWYELYCETVVRNNLQCQTKDYFKSLFLNQSKGNKGVKVSLLMADYNGVFIASMFLVLSNTRGTYLFGASSSQYKHLMGSYALQWEAIKRAKKHGCIEYDMFGCAPNLNQSHPLYGVHLYKKGFGGRLFHRMGCWDYPYLLKTYNLISSLEIKN